MLYEMRLVGLAMDPFSNSPIVILKDRESVDAEQAQELEDGQDSFDDISHEEIHVELTSDPSLQAVDAAADADVSADAELSTDADLVAVASDVGEDNQLDAASEAAEGDVHQPRNVDASDVLEDHETLLQELEDAAPFVSNQPPQKLDNTVPHSDERILPIWIGESEAHAIATVLLGLSPPRPMTHDLLFESIKALGGEVKRVIVTDLRDNTFYATIELSQAQEGGEIFYLDARPSDAIALALRSDADIFVESRVLEKTKQSDSTPQFDEDELEELDNEQWKELVESLSGDSAKKYTQ